MLSSSQRFAAAGALAIGAVLVALVTQYGFDMQPCPWCILQRLQFVVAGVLALAAAAITARPARWLLGGLAIAVCLSGIAAALYQHFVAAKLASCALTFADRFLNALNVEKWWPAVFQVRGSCADAAVDLLGLPYEFWSLGVFAITALVLTSALISRSRR